MSAIFRSSRSLPDKAFPRVLTACSPFFWLAVRLWIGGVFLYAGFSKLTAPAENFRAMVADYPVIPAVFIPAIAAVSPWFEYVFGAFLILGYAPRLSAAALSLFSFGFAVLVATRREFWSGGAASCGCFGEGWFQPTLRQIFAVDVLNAVLGARLFFLGEIRFGLDSLLAGGGRD